MRLHKSLPLVLELAAVDRALVVADLAMLLQLIIREEGFLAPIFKTDTNDSSRVLLDYVHSQL